MDLSKLEKQLCEYVAQKDLGWDVSVWVATVAHHLRKTRLDESDHPVVKAILAFDRCLDAQNTVTISRWIAYLAYARAKGPGWVPSNVYDKRASGNIWRAMTKMRIVDWREEGTGKKSLRSYRLLDDWEHRVTPKSVRDAYAVVEEGRDYPVWLLEDGSFRPVGALITRGAAPPFVPHIPLPGARRYVCPLSEWKAFCKR